MGRVPSGPDDPYCAALLPAAELGLGYNNFEAHELLVAVGENRAAHPDFEFGVRVQSAIEACERSHETRARARVDNRA